MKRILSVIYTNLRHFLRWHEEQEIPITAFELALSFVGVVQFGRALIYAIYRKGIDSEALSIGSLELLAFVTLFISIAARLAVILRARNLGIDFGVLFSGRGSALDERLLHQLAEVGSRSCYLGSVISAETETRRSVLRHIALESAMRFSIRTYGKADMVWKTWEERYLGDWLARFPAAIWRLPPDSPNGGEDSGYFSVAVPVNEDAWNKVRFGHLSTALCAIDGQAIAHFNSLGCEAFSRPIYVVFYTVIYVPTGLKGDIPDPLKILYAGVEHLAYLMSRFYPAPGAARAATLSVVCESSNSSLEVALRAMGFAPVKPDLDFEQAPSHVSKSVAGFQLFEIRYQNGKPITGDPLKAERFLDLLCRIARRDLPEPTIPKEDRKMTENGRPNSGPPR